MSKAIVIYTPLLDPIGFCCGLFVIVAFMLWINHRLEVALRSTVLPKPIAILLAIVISFVSGAALIAGWAYFMIGF